MRYKNLCDFIDNELKELDRKAASDGSLSAQEVEFADLLTHMKKSMLTSEAMEGGGYSEKRGSVTYRNDGYGDGYSDGYNDGYERRGYSEGHGYGARDRKGRYTRMYRDDGDMMSELQKMADKAPNEQVKRRYREFMDELKDMM